jgi:hypothetical protein
MATIESHAAGEAPVAAARHLHPVGILFVHGIGQQGRGQTLVEFGEPLHRWIDDWLRGASTAWIRNGLDAATWESWVSEHQARWDQLPPEKGMRCRQIARDVGERAAVAAVEGAPFGRVEKRVGARSIAGRAALLDARVSADADPGPRNATLQLSVLEANGGLRTATWLLAESFWARSFAAPSYGTLARWGFAYLPAILACHFGSRMRRAWTKQRTGRFRRLRQRASFLFRVVMFMVGLLGGLGIMALLVLLSPLAMLPFKPVQGVLKALQRVLAATLGDSYVLCASPMQAAAIVGQVRRDLEWLGERCRAVVLVGHSQGAAVAFEAIRRGAPRSLRRFLSFGSGLRKLQELRQTMDGVPTYRRAGLLALAGMAMVAVALGHLIGAGVPGLAWLTWPPAGPWVVPALTAGLAALGVGIGASWSAFDLRDVRLWGESFTPGQLVWEDYYAHGDPVPNGPLFDDDEDQERLEETARFVRSSEVHNRASMLSDHTSYWANREQFVSRVANAADMLTDFALHRLLPKDGELLAVARKRRHWRVGMLRLGRWVTTIAGVALLAWGGDIVPALGSGTAAFLRWGGGSLAALVGIRWTPPLDDARWQAPLGWLAGSILVALVYRLLVAKTWQWWDRRQGELLTQRLDLQKAEFRQVVFVAVVVTVVAALASAMSLGIASVRSGLGRAWPLVIVAMAALAAAAFAATQWWWRRVKPKHEELHYGSPYSVEVRPAQRRRARALKLA